MKKIYEKPEADVVCFEPVTDFAAISDVGPSFSPLDWVNDKFEKIEDGLLDIMSGISNG